MGDSVNKIIDIESDIPKEELNWCSVKLSEVFSKDIRFEASVFEIEGKHAREVVLKNKWGVTTLTGENGLATAYHRPRFKRIWVNKSELPIFQPAQVTEINPRPAGYLSENTNTDIEALRVAKGQILLTCSGTIGNSTLVSETLDNQIFSHDLIRITAKTPEDTGYIYTFLQTEIGKRIINTNSYGSVISHIEPEHLNDIPIPNAPKLIKSVIAEYIQESFKCRDISNQLLQEAEDMLMNELKLPPLDSIKVNMYDNDAEFVNTSVKLSKLNGRFEGSYHLPIISEILEMLEQNSKCIKKVSDSDLTYSVFLPGRFTRIYVDKGQGTVFFGGRQILGLDPSISNKYLSTTLHSDRLKEQLILKKNTILISRSGTIGKLAIVPEHWEGWSASEDLIRIFPKEDYAGYIYVFLNSEYGQELIKRFVYGSVQDHIEDIHVGEIEIPILKSEEKMKEINEKALEAVDLRAKAYKLEQKAISKMEEEVFKI